MGATIYALGPKAYACLRAAESLPCAKAIEAVVIGRDRTVEDDHAEQIAQWCDSMRIAHQPMGGPASASKHAMAIGWRWMVPVGGGQQLVVLHDSLLPRYRGFAPLVSALVNGDRRLGVTALLGAEEYDSGPILGQASVEIEYPITLQAAIARITGCYQTLFTSILQQIHAGQPLEGQPQDESRATYSLWRDERDFYIDWTDSAERIRRMVDAVGPPYAGARTRVGGRDVLVIEARELDDVVVENRTAGKVIFRREGKLVVVCGKGLLMLTELREPDGSPCLIEKFRLRFE